MPEENEELQETLDWSKPDYVFIPKGNHQYKQRGYYIVCVSCEIQHAFCVGPDKILCGIDEKGAPIIKTRKELNMV